MAFNSTHTTDEKFRVDNKVAIVYGGSYGIGKSISQILSQQGATVIIVARNQEKGEACVSSLTGCKKLYIQSDVSCYEDHERITRTVIELYHKIDIIVCCAGTFSPDWSLLSQHYTSEYISNMIDVNLKGSIYAVKSTIEHLKMSTSGRIIFISSITGTKTGFHGGTIYGATKSGQFGFAHNLAVELAQYKITVNCILPGDTLTEGLIAEGETYIENMKKNMPLGRLGSPDDVGNAVLFLASSEASFITGQEMIVDGGQTKNKCFSD